MPRRQDFGPIWFPWPANLGIHPAIAGFESGARCDAAVRQRVPPFFLVQQQVEELFQIAAIQAFCVASPKLPRVRYAAGNSIS